MIFELIFPDSKEIQVLTPIKNELKKMEFMMAMMRQTMLCSAKSEQVFVDCFL